MKFELKKGILFLVILVLIPILLIIYALSKIIREINNLNSTQHTIILICFIIIVIITYLLTIKTYFDSFYIVDNKKILCKFGLFKKTIEINKINSISKGDYPSSGFKPALNFTGIHINHGTGHSIFLSPENQQEFVNKLKLINPEIRII